MTKFQIKNQKDKEQSCIFPMKKTNVLRGKLVFNKRSPTQVVRFWGRSVLKLNPERAVEIPEKIILVQNFTADLMAQRPDFYLPPFGRYS